MKKLFLAIVVLISFSISAFALPVLEGSFKFNDAQLTVAQAKHTVRLIVMNEESRVLLQTYRDQSYTCTAQANSQYMCQKFVNELPLSTSVENQILSEMKGSILHFEKTEFEPEQINDSPLLKEWTLIQMSRFKDQKFIKTRFTQVEGLLKFSLEAENSEKVYFHFENEKISAQLFRTTSQTKTSPYEIQNSVMFNVSVQWLAI